MKKKTIIVALALLILNKIFSQTDTSRIVRDSLYNHKANYIGQPLSKLINDIKIRVSFSYADNRGNRTRGNAYYQETIVFINTKSGYGVSGFKIKLANKVYVELSDLYKIGRDAWNKKLESLLGKEILLEIDKF